LFKKVKIHLLFVCWASKVSKATWHGKNKHLEMILELPGQELLEYVCIQAQFHERFYQSCFFFLLLFFLGTWKKRIILNAYLFHHHLLTLKREVLLEHPSNFYKKTPPFSLSVASEENQCKSTNTVQPVYKIKSYPKILYKNPSC